jgi:DNA-binding transcriptional regulator YiaG
MGNIARFNGRAHIQTQIIKLVTDATRIRKDSVTFVDGKRRGPFGVNIEDAVRRACANAQQPTLERPVFVSMYNGHLFSLCRRTLDYTVDELSDVLRVNPRTLRRWEGGKRDISDAAWEALFYALQEAGRAQLCARINARPR